MKANMTEHGVMVLSPESSLESYALSQWMKAAFIEVDDARRGETNYVRGSMILVTAEVES